MSNSAMEIIERKHTNNRISLNIDYNSANSGSFNIPQRSLTVNAGNYSALSNNLPQKMINKLKARNQNDSRLQRDNNHGAQYASKA